MKESDLPSEAFHGTDHVKRLVDWGKGLAPIMYYWDRLIDSWVTADGFVRDSKGRPQFRIDGWWDQAKMAFGAEPDKGLRYKVLNRIMSDEEAQRQRRTDDLGIRFTKAFVRGNIPDDILDDIGRFMIDADAIDDWILRGIIPPEIAVPAKQRLLKEVEAYKRLDF
jgi:hypothetical protein